MLYGRHIAIRLIQLVFGLYVHFDCGVRIAMNIVYIIRKYSAKFSQSKNKYLNKKKTIPLLDIIIILKLMLTYVITSLIQFFNAMLNYTDVECFLLPFIMVSITSICPN